MKRSRLTCTALLLAALLCLALGCGKPAEPAAPAEIAAPAEEPAAPAEETAAPAEEPAALDAEPAAAGSAYNGIKFSSTDLNGRKITENYIRDNKVTVVNFWATWCPPCVGEIPDFSEVAAAYAGKGVGFLGVQLDEDTDAAKALWDKHGVSYPTILPDGDLVAMANTMQYVPDTILLDSNGRQIGETQIGSLEKDALTALIDAALSAQ